MSKSIRVFLPLFLCLFLLACLVPKAHADSLQTLLDAIDAYNQGAGANNYTVTGNIDEQETTLTIPAGFTVNVQGRLMLRGVNLNGTVSLGPSGAALLGRFGDLVDGHPQGKLALSGGAQVRISPDGLLMDEDTLGSWVSFSGNANNVVVCYEVSSDNALRQALNKAKALPEHYFGSLRILYNAHLTNNCDWNLDGNGVTQLEVLRNFTVTVDSGVTLISQYINCYPQSNLIVNGTIVNTDRLELRNARLSVQQGTVTGPGCIYIQCEDDPLNHVDNLALTPVIEGRDRDGFFEYRCVDELTGLQEAIEHGVPAVILRSDLTIPAGIVIDSSNTKIRIPTGVTVTVSGKLTVGDLEIQQNQQARGVVLVTDGGELHVTKWLDLSNNIWTTWVQNGSADRITFGDEGGFVLHRGDCATSLDILTFTLVDAGETLGENRHLRFDFGIPAGTQIDASGITLDIPIGVTVTVNGRLILGDLILRADIDAGVGGEITVAEGGEIHVSKWLDIANITWDGWLEDGSADRITYADDAGFNLHRGAGSAGMDFDGLARAFYDADHYLVRQNLLFTIHIVDTINARDTEYNTVTVADRVILDVGSPLICDALTIQQGGSVTLNNAWVETRWDSWENVAASGACIRYEGDAGFLFRTEANTGNRAFELLNEAQGIVSAIDPVHARPVIELNCNWTINRGDVTYGLGGGELHLNQGHTLTVNGMMLLDRFSDDGTVVVGEEGFLYAQSDFSIGEDVTQGMFTLNGTLSIDHQALIPEQLEVLTIGDNGVIDISFNFFTEDAVLTELDAPVALFPHFRRSLWVLFPWTLDSNLTLPPQVHLCVDGSGDQAGLLTVADGAVLTVPEESQLFACGDRGETIIRLNGGLVNNGEVKLGDDYSEPGEIAMGEKGFYCGGGTVVRDGHPYLIQNSRTNADLVLPASLTTLQSKALASGTFRSVYIPAGATAIASDAFGDRTGLVIFGAPGSAAETFAAGKGFLFAPVT